MTLRLLVVDDNPDYRLLVGYALRGTEIDVVGEAQTADDGIEQAARLQPDVVLLDILMQGTDGLLAVRPIQDVAPRAAVVAVASYDEHELWGRASHLDRVWYLSKAIRPSQLCDELMRIAHAASVGSDVVATARQRLPADPASARSARRFVATTLASWGCGDIEDEALLLVSELVTNALIHARTEVEVALRLRPDRLRVEVVDFGTDGVRRRDATSEAQSGRGMALTEALASAWGIDYVLAGKIVWFEMACRNTRSTAEPGSEPSP